MPSATGRTFSACEEHKRLPRQKTHTYCESTGFLIDGKFAVLFSRVSDFLAGNDPYLLHHGEALAFLNSLPDECADALITDPPYSSGGRTATERTSRTTTQKYIQSGTKRQYVNFDGDSRDQRGYLAWCAIWLGECYRILKPGSPIVVFTDWRQLPVTTDALQAGGFIWRGIAPWNKTRGCRPQLGRFAAQCEYMVWGSKGNMPNDRDAPCLDGVFTHPVKQADKHHLTGKPTPLLLDVVQITERPTVDYRPLILDPFAGSGTTLVAAVEQGYRGIGCEWGDENAQIATARLEEARVASAHWK